jgi:putative exosortase-associated protein (TIGR04073 family)
MKKWLVSLVLAVMMITVSTAGAYADNTESYFCGMGHKLTRGVWNAATGWVEIPVQMIKGYCRAGTSCGCGSGAAGFLAGIFKGVWFAAGRTLSGAGDIAGFWAADPCSNECIGIPLDDDCVTKEGTPYNLYDPSFGCATLNPMGRKFARGLGNTLFGIAEVPGQICKGTKSCLPDMGIVKGVWYFLSREVDGVFEMATFAFPNPVETKGMPFDEANATDALSSCSKACGQKTCKTCNACKPCNTSCGCKSCGK